MVLSILRGVFFLSLAIFLLQEALIYPGWTSSLKEGKGYRDAASLPPNVRSHFLRTADGDLFEFWEVNPEREDADIAFVFDGNASTLRGSMLYARSLGSIGYRTFIVSYRGFGRSTGVPGDKKLQADIALLISWLRAKDPSFSEKRKIALGISLGSAGAAYLAREVALDTLVLLSSFTSVRDVVREHLFYQFFTPLLRHPLPVLETLKVLPTKPCLVLSHGTADPVIPFSHFERLQSELADDFTIYPIVKEGGGHMIFHLIEDEVRRGIESCMLGTNRRVDSPSNE